MRRFSEHETPSASTDVFVVDVLGILPEMYAAARGRPVFVAGGGSLRGLGAGGRGARAIYSLAPLEVSNEQTRGASLRVALFYTVVAREMMGKTNHLKTNLMKDLRCQYERGTVTRAETCPCLAGGSLYPGSRGHNVAEATLAGCSVLVGSHHETFKSIIDDINEEDKEEDEEDDEDDVDDVSTVGVVSVDEVGGGGDGRQVKKVCEVVTCEEELCRGVELRLDDVAFAAASGAAATARTRVLASGVLEGLWSALSAQLFVSSPSHSSHSKVK